MSPSLFAHAIFKNEPLKIFNYGKMHRDFTYIDDIVNGVIKVLDKIPIKNPEWDNLKMDPASSSAPYALITLATSIL